MIARAVGLSLGSEAELKKMSDTALKALLKENDPEYQEEEADDKQAPKGKRLSDDPRTGNKILCRIEIGQDNSEKGPVYACVNGYDFQAPRGKEIELDEGFIEHLESQFVTESEAVLDDKGRPTGEVIERDRPRFQVTRLTRKK